MKYIDDISSPMGNINYPLREALKAQSIRQDYLTEKIRKSRQTVSRYITKYEQYGKVGDELAQQEFDRIMAEEKQRLSALSNNETRIKKVQEEKRKADDKMASYNEQYIELLSGILDNHPDVQLYDIFGKPISHGEAKTSRVLFRLESNDALVNVLTPSERGRWEALDEEIWKIVRVIDDSENIEEAYNLESLWDSTISEGKPTLYRDRMYCETVHGDAKIIDDMECDTFCLCYGDSAKIYIEGPEMLEYKYGTKIAVYVNIYVITDKRVVNVASEVKLEECDGLRVSGTVDGLVPGYKYLYNYCIVGDDDEHPLPWEFNSCVYHPLK